MRAGVIDIGSSSIKLVIGEKVDDRINILESLRNALPIGKSTFLKGRISQDIINQTTGLLEKYKEKLQEYEVSNVKVIATTAVREAKNKDIFVDTLSRTTGFHIEVLNVGDVVYYIDTFLSLKLKKTYPIFEKNLLIAELGAGSLDISVMEKGQTILNLGIPVGTLRLKQFKGKIEGSMSEMNEAVKEYIESQILYLKEILPKLLIDDIILIDENYSSYIQNILPDKKLESNFFQFKAQEAEDFLAKLSDSNIDDIRTAHKIPQEVADTIDAFGIIVNTLFKLTKNKYIYILVASLPEALLANVLYDFELSKMNNKTNQLISVAKFICKKYDVDLGHAEYVAGLSETLFKGLKETLGLEDKDLLYLLLAAYLHDIGKFINNRSHHKHTEYIISSLSLFRLTDEEVKMIACIGRYHRKSPPLRTHIIYGSLSSDRQIMVQKLSSLLRMANALDSSHIQKVKKMDVKIDKKQEVSVVVFSNENFILERTNFSEKKDMFEEISGNKVSLVIKNQT